MRVATTKCRQFGHPDFVLEADDANVPGDYLTDVAKTIEDMVAVGSVFKPGQTFQIGWGLTRVEPSGEALALAEPDMVSFPIKWTQGVTNTLRQMMLQLLTLDSVGLRRKIDIPSIAQSLVACTHYRERSFLLVRSPEYGGSDSGWFIGCLNGGHDHQDSANLRCISLYEAFLNQPGIARFASFPVGSVIEVDQQNGLKLFKDSAQLEIIPGSFLDEWLKKHRL